MLRYFGIICFCFLFIIAGCSTERNLARKYLKSHSGNGIMIIPVFELYKNNLTIAYDTNVEYTPGQLDSIAWSQSCYISHVSDSVFLTLFTDKLVEQLNTLGYDVYVDGSSDIFLSLPDPKWIVQIAQLEINEDHRTDYEELYSFEDGEPYYKEFRINQVNMNSWFEVSRANTGNKQLLYLDAYIQDDFKLGIDVDLMQGNLGFLGNRDSLEMDNVYEMAEQSGQKHADLLFDYFMNDYIRENLPAGIVNREYFHYNSKTKSLKRGLVERFDVVN